mmetsp:Transcript_6839/g.8637  ORF Transcript_6839/g.8637 Transcript_6839/m.8637 type:complete len:82 (-) Transcript_6839:266-511(-)
MKKIAIDIKKEKKKSSPIKASGLARRYDDKRNIRVVDENHGLRIINNFQSNFFLDFHNNNNVSAHARTSIDAHRKFCTPLL